MGDADRRAAVTHAGRVLVVDDQEANRALLVHLLAAQGYRVRTATDGESALAAVSAEAPEIVLLDIQMPGIDGLEVCRRLKRDPATRLVPIVILTGSDERSHRIEGIDAGADDFLVKPFDGEELRARIRSLISLKRYTDELESAESVILTLAATVEARDPYTEGHCHRLSSYARALGATLGLSTQELAALHRGAYLHDVGKIAIPDTVLRKAGRLTPSEFKLMKEHTVIGERLCGNLRSLEPVRPIIRHHHEQRDGSGYPDGLRGDNIPLLAQIVGVVDIYDALTTNRPYRDAVEPPQAFKGCDHWRRAGSGAATW